MVNRKPLWLPGNPYNHGGQQFNQCATGADAQGKRALLDELEVTVEVDGTHFWIDGVLKDLGLKGDIGVQPQTSLTR
jgi:hypothetical protein